MWLRFDLLSCRRRLAVLAFNLTLARVEAVLPSLRTASRSWVSAEDVEEVDVGDPSSASAESVGEPRRVVEDFWLNNLEEEGVFSGILAPQNVTPDERRSSNLREMSLRFRQDSERAKA